MGNRHRKKRADYPDQGLSTWHGAISVLGLDADRDLDPVSLVAKAACRKTNPEAFAVFRRRSAGRIAG